MAIPLDHRERLPASEFLNGSQVHFRHDQTRCERMA